MHENITLYHKYITICLLLIIISCQNKSIDNNYLNHITDPNTKHILQQAIEQAGGMDLYKSIKSIEYVKRSVLYTKDGSIESDKIEKHEITLSPIVSGRLRQIIELDTIDILLKDDIGSKLINGVEQEGQSESAYQSFMSAYYVLFMPFKLLDEGTSLSYGNKYSLDGKDYDLIKASYDPTSHENHSTSDEWYYFFEPETGQFAASAVYHSPTYALIENNEQVQVSGLTLNAYRKSWRVDSLFNKEYLRGEFWYTEYLIYQ